MNHAPTIRLHGARPPLDVRSSDVYFPFASGRLEYDCVACNAKCCRGHGYGIQPGHELQTHLKTAPSVRFFLEDVTPAHGTNYAIRNCAPGCFFLTDDGRCGIQARHGYDAKPETCRLFPFNNIRLAGSYLIAAPHTGLCPLAIAPPSRKSALSDHEALTDAMRMSGIGAHVPRTGAEVSDISALVRFERQIVDLSETCLDDADYLAFAIAQIELTDSVWGQDDRRSAAERLAEYASLVDEILGGPLTRAASKDQALERTLIALTPFVRSMLVFPSDDDKMPVALDRVPYALVALRTLALHARDAGMPVITFQSLMHIVQPNKPLLAMLAQSNREMRWRAEANVELPLKEARPYRCAYLRIVRALLPASQNRSPMKLGHILRNNLESDGVERAMTLKALARQLAGRCVPTHHASVAPKPRGFRVALQQWAIGTFSEDALLMMAELELARKSPQALSAAGAR